MREADERASGASAADRESPWPLGLILLLGLAAGLLVYAQVAWGRSPTAKAVAIGVFLVVLLVGGWAARRRSRPRRGNDRAP